MEEENVIQQAFRVYEIRKRALEETQRQKKIEAAKLASEISSKILNIFYRDSRIKRILVDNQTLEVKISFTKDMRADFISVNSTRDEGIILLARSVQQTRGELVSPPLIMGKMTEFFTENLCMYFNAYGEKRGTIIEIDD